jgi:hypothetical protein
MSRNIRFGTPNATVFFKSQKIDISHKVYENFAIPTVGRNVSRSKSQQIATHRKEWES